MLLYETHLSELGNYRLLEWADLQESSDQSYSSTCDDSLDICLTTWLSVKRKVRHFGAGLNELI